MDKNMDLLGKRILYKQSEIVYNDLLEAGGINKWNVYHSKWHYTNHELTGCNSINRQGMCILKERFPYEIMLEFKARTIEPCSHGIGFMWNGCFESDTQKRGPAYLGVLQGWWRGKIGFEKSPEHKLIACRPWYDFVAGKEYLVQAGTIHGHCFIFVDNQLMIELMDPAPIDYMKSNQIGFEVFSSQVQIKDIMIRKIRWEPLLERYKG
jgi:hypothetical protein